MKLAIVGTRNPGVSYKEWESLLLSKVETLDVSLIVSGGAMGIDAFAERWAESNSINTKIFKPDYKSYGKAAPLVRNKKIVEECDKVVAFPSEESRGTYHTLDYARKLRKRITIIEL